MKKNQELEVTCTDLSDLGFGIAHHDGMTIFVSDLLPEETALIRILKVQKTYAIGKVIKRLTTSPNRTTPICPKANCCGGCQLMHIQYPAQLQYKEKQLKDLFASVSKETKVLPPLGMKEPYFYRNKAQFPIAVKDGKIISGFYKPRSNDIVPVEECFIQSKKINEIYQWLLAHLTLDQAKFLRHLFIRHSAKTGQVQVVFIGMKNHGLKKLAHQLVSEHPEVKSVVFNENLRNDNVILGDDYEVLFGSDSLEEQCLDLSILLHFKSFFQVNPSQMEVLYSKALEMANLTKDDEVIELYSGTGTIGLLASKQAKKVIGVEIVPEAVENAKENQRRNHIENAEFVCMDATDFVRQNEKPADVVFIDPPRKGMSPQGIQDVCDLQPKRIVYISCNPRTLVRDIKLFEEHGYKTPVIQPVDMFSQTTGMECIALIEPENLESDILPA